MEYFLAIDLGATSGRHIVAYQENNELKFEEVHRFLTGMKESSNGLVWDIPNLTKEIKVGIKKAFAKYNNIVSLAIDTWGVDYVLLDKDNIDILPYFSYRNNRLHDAYKKVHEIVPFEYLYEHTGIQFATFNTIYQLYDDLNSGRLNNAENFLMLPEYFTYKLTGIMCHEYSEHSTSGLLNAENKDYDFEIINKLSLPKKLFTKIFHPGHLVGDLNKNVQQEVGGNCKVVLCATHDTGSAFEAIDSPEDSIIISSGTWSLIGVKLDKANTSEESFKANFTNEGGVGYIRYLKNIMGMWIVNQICQEKSLNIKEICESLLEKNISYKEIFDVNDESLTAPKSMEKAVKDLLVNNPPKDDLELFASIYHSMAFSYKKACEQLEKVLNKSFSSIYIVGGGAKNHYLNQLVKQYTNKEVIALPIEATSIGNIKVQMKAMGKK